MIHENQEQRKSLFMAVPETAAGFLGEKPMVQWIKVSKGSRPIGVVSSVEGLALKVGTGRLLEVWDTRGVG